MLEARVIETFDTGSPWSAPTEDEILEICRRIREGEEGPNAHRWTDKEHYDRMGIDPPAAEVKQSKIMLPRDRCSAVS